jgi:hypothetical protein
MVLDGTSSQVIDHACVGDNLVNMLQQPRRVPAAGLEQQASLERDRSRKGWCSRDHDRATGRAERGYCELTVTGVDRVVLRDTGRHILKVV